MTEARKEFSEGYPITERYTVERVMLVRGSNPYVRMCLAKADDPNSSAIVVFDNRLVTRKTTKPTVQTGDSVTFKVEAPNTGIITAVHRGRRRILPTPQQKAG